MTIRTTTFALLLLAAAAPLAAQEAPAEDPAAPEAAAPGPADPVAEAPAEAPADAAEAPAAEPAADPGAELDMGTPVADAEPEPGAPYVKEEFGDWSLRCVRTEEAVEVCQLYQLLLDGEGNAVAEISLFPLPEGGQAAAGATIVAPLETLLTENLTLSIDGGAARTYPFTFCNRAGCVARVGFTAEELQQFKSGNAATLAIVPAAAPDQTVSLNVSLTGFTAGYDGTAAVAPPTAGE